VPPDVARKHFQAHLEYYERQAEQWRERAAGFRERRSDLLVERLKHTPPERHAAVIAFKALAFDGQAARADVEVAWARTALALIEDLDAPAG
jgi:PadR family transcriptional regulator AphA